jgi:hypothetical protein
MEDEFAALVNSDLARDVRAELVRHFTAGASIANATVQTLAEFRDVLADPNEGPVIFLAVAMFQLDHDQLQSFIRDAAVDLIESGEAESAWKATESGVRQQRRALLQQFLTLLKEATPAVG